MTDALVQFLRARIDETHGALLTYRDGHPGRCLNYGGQDPEYYDEHDSCYLHLEAAAATPYRDIAFGLAEVDAKRQALYHYERVQQHTLKSDGGDDYVFAEGAVRKQIQYMALPYADHPDYRTEWRP